MSNVWLKLYVRYSSDSTLDKKDIQTPDFVNPLLCGKMPPL